ncbi:MAG: ABC transporter permease [Nocardioides sp.]
MTSSTSPVTTADNGSGGARHPWLLVAGREVMVRSTDRTFLIGTLVTVAILIGVTVLQVWLASRTDRITLLATPEAESMATAVAAAAREDDDDLVVTVRRVADRPAAERDLRAEEADAWLHRADGDWTLTTLSQPEGALEEVTADVVRQQVLTDNAGRAGTTLEALQRGTELRTGLLEGDDDRASLTALVGFAFAMLFYLASLVFGMSLANSVVEEKQSRIVEIIATAIPLRQLLLGKVVGNSVLALAQLGIYVAVGLIGLSFTEYGGLVPQLSSPVLWFMAFFVGGFAAIACLWAVAGSLASRTEDLQATTTPLTILVLVVFFGGLTLEDQWQTAGSFVPPLSAVVMPIRLLEGDAAWWEAAVALGLLFAMAALTIRLGERIYRNSLLQTGGKVSLRAAWSAEE